MAKANLKVTHQDAVVKVYGGNETSETIDISALLPGAGQGLDGATQVVNITGVVWTGDNNATITVSRGGVTVLTLPCTGAATIDFDGQTLPPDNVNNTSDIVVAIATSAGEAQCYLKLRKASGYATFIEPEQYGAYDDPTQAGS